MDTEHIVYTDRGKLRLAEVEAYLQALEDQAFAERARAEFAQRLGYLDGYGGAGDEHDPRRRFRVVLDKDWSPLSFSVTWQRLDPATGEYLFAFNGGLIFHGGATDPLSISLTPCLWGIHT